MTPKVAVPAIRPRTTRTTASRRSSFERRAQSIRFWSRLRSRDPVASTVMAIPDLQAPGNRGPLVLPTAVIRQLLHNCHSLFHTAKDLYVQLANFFPQGVAVEPQKARRAQLIAGGG